MLRCLKTLDKFLSVEKGPENRQVSRPVLNPMEATRPHAGETLRLKKSRAGGHLGWREPEDRSLSRAPHLEGHLQLLPVGPRPQVSLMFAWKLRSQSASASSPSEAVVG